MGHSPARRNPVLLGMSATALLLFGGCTGESDATQSAQSVTSLNAVDGGIGRHHEDGGWARHPDEDGDGGRDRHAKEHGDGGSCDRADGGNVDEGPDPRRDGGEGRRGDGRDHR